MSFFFTFTFTHRIKQSNHTDVLFPVSFFFASSLTSRGLLSLYFLNYFHPLPFFLLSTSSWLSKPAASFLFLIRLQFFVRLNYTFIFLPCYSSFLCYVHREILHLLPLFHLHIFILSDDSWYYIIITCWKQLTRIHDWICFNRPHIKTIFLFPHYAVILFYVYFLDEYKVVTLQ